MDTIVFLTVLGAALMHASWNALVKAGADRFAFTVVLTFAECLLGLALAPFFPMISLPRRSGRRSRCRHRRPRLRT